MSGILRERLIDLIEPAVQRLGYELVELEYSAGRNGVLRIFIDAPTGVGLDDCERASRELSALLDVADPLPGAYALEVSSPGADRVLRTPAHFARFVGERVFVEIKEPRVGERRRRYTGTLLAAGPQEIALQVDGERVAMEYGQIGKARLASLDDQGTPQPRGTDRKREARQQ